MDWISCVWPWFLPMFLWRLHYFGASVWSCLSDSGELYGWEAARGVAVPIPERELLRFASAAQRVQSVASASRADASLH